MVDEGCENLPVLHQSGIHRSLRIWLASWRPYQRLSWVRIGRPREDQPCSGDLFESLGFSLYAETSKDCQFFKNMPTIPGKGYVFSLLLLGTYTYSDQAWKQCFILYHENSPRTYLSEGTRSGGHCEQPQ